MINLRYPSKADDVVTNAVNALRVADVINHPTFGEGIVTGINDDLVDIDFNGTSKTLGLQWLYDNLINRR